MRVRSPAGTSSRVVSRVAVPVSRVELVLRVRLVSVSTARSICTMVSGAVFIHETSTYSAPGLVRSCSSESFCGRVSRSSRRIVSRRLLVLSSISSPPWPR
jgi:hypothetical protein